jgi:hypothetical protein
MDSRQRRPDRRRPGLPARQLRLRHYLLTGEHRQYDPKDGHFIGTKVRSQVMCMAGQSCPRGIGAWSFIRCAVFW